MYVITNRKLHEAESGLKVFGKEPNEHGPNELRLVEVNGETRFSTQVLSDKLGKEEVTRLIKGHDLPIDP
ncbi:MAG: hypothetical protein ACK5HY_11280, partial [Parahaliea sp.]